MSMTGRPSTIDTQVATESGRLREELRRKSVAADAIGGLGAIIVLPLVIGPHVATTTLIVWSALMLCNHLFGYLTYVLNVGSAVTRQRTNQVWHVGVALTIGAIPWLSTALRKDFGPAMLASLIVLVILASDALYFPQTMNSVWLPFSALPTVSLALAHAVSGRWALGLGVLGVAVHLLGGATSVNALVDQLIGQRVQSERNEKEAQEASLRDSLTGLLSRRGIETRISEWLIDAPKRVACAVVDIDDFKQINDLWGHEIGDRTLVTVGERLEAALPDWHVSRLGADEFLIVAAGPLTQQRQDQLRQLTLAPTVRSNTSASAGAACRVSVGATSVSGEELTITRLFGEASAALRRAKQRGKGQLAIMDDQLLAEYEDLIRLGGPVADAIQDGEIQPFGQTIVDMRSGDVVGVELLARWLRPNGQMEMPGVFIPVIEHRGLGEALGDAMMGAAARFASELRAAGSDAYVSVNISASHLASPTLLNRVSQVLHDHRCPPEALLIEVTESESLADLRGWTENAERLRKLGVGLAIDDFGTGYSSIAQLLELPFSHLKVDRSIVQQVTESSTRSLLLGLRKFAENAGITLVAEGVELESERQRLLELGIVTCQGYLFSRPLALDAVFRLVANQTPMAIPFPDHQPERRDEQPASRTRQRHPS